MSTDQAREILRGAGRKPVREVDVLSDEGDGRDPLLDEGTTLEEVLGYAPEEDAEPAKEEPAETTETAEAGTETPAACTTEEPPIKTEADGRKRVNIFRKNADGSFVHSDLTRRAMIMADEHGIDLIDALKTLGAGDRLSEKAAEAAPAKKEPTAAEIDAQIADLEKQIEDAEDVTFNDDLARKLNRQLRQLLPQRQDALLRDMQAKQAERETQGTFETQVSASFERAKAVYPEAVNEGSNFNVAAQAYTDQLFATNSPLLKQADWPEVALAIVAAREGVAAVIPIKAAPKVAAAPVAAKPAPRVAPLKRATPVPPPGSVSSAPAKVDPRKELERQIDATRDPAELQKLMRKAVELDRAA